MSKVEQFLTAEEVAEAFKMHPYTIRRLCREKKIPCFKFGGQWRLDSKELKKWQRIREKA
ncbi:MAG: helix-turn-helix domain-containing protein [Candidatus Tantalella remota]|nr:helix-turn-helix domain-containing protein [Candidatus Tantalella remota]